MKNHVAVLGAGNLGAAVATLLARAGVPVGVWARRVDVARKVASNANGSFAAQSIVEVCEGAAMVAFCVPTSALREVARAAGEVARGDQVALHACRGVGEHFTLPHELIRAET